MIKIIKTRNLLDQELDSQNGKSIGLVPTMGNLHEGHLSLLASAIAENDLSIITIFVNPKQFGPNEDFNKYPRTLEEDIKKIESIKPIDSTKTIIIFAPKSDREIYPNNFSTSISVGELKTILCGKVRPTHFDGVTTVVYRLFKLSRANNAYFGQKDYQQCIIIKKMIRDLEIPVTMHIKPIIRNVDGLALSSRNQYLNDDEKKLALHLPSTLIKIEHLIINQKSYQALITQELSDPRWDYLQVLDADSLNEKIDQSKKVVIVGAFRLGNTRLLDNRVVKC